MRFTETPHVFLVPNFESYFGEREKVPIVFERLSLFKYKSTSRLKRAAQQRHR